MAPWQDWDSVIVHAGQVGTEGEAAPVGPEPGLALVEQRVTMHDQPASAEACPWALDDAVEEPGASREFASPAVPVTS